MWAYARGAFDPEPGVVYDFCEGRGGKYPTEFLKGWSGTLVVDAYGGYDSLLALPGRSTAYCFAHARRKFDELFEAHASPIAAQAIERIAWLYRIEAAARALPCPERHQVRQERSRPPVFDSYGRKWLISLTLRLKRAPTRGSSAAFDWVV
jgi:transposase